jgi:hypothetical protein
MHATSTTDSPCLTSGMLWSVLMLCGELLVAGGCSRPQSPVANVPESQAGAITVVFILPDGEVRREMEAVAPGTSIADVMAKIDDPKIEMTGTGATAFVKSIGNLGTTDGKGWTFSVDGQWADRGIGAYALTPPATIRWKHGAFDPSEQ